MWFICEVNLTVTSIRQFLKHIVLEKFFACMKLQNPKQNKLCAPPGDSYIVETVIVQADFVKGRPIYREIEKHLQDKDIGILGEWLRLNIYISESNLLPIKILQTDMLKVVYDV